MQELLELCPKLRRHAVRVAVDLLAVASGHRPAFLLDYAHAIPVNALATACERLSRAWQQHRSAFCVLRWQGLVWVVNCQLLEKRLERLLNHQQEPGEMLLISFVEESEHELQACLEAVHDVTVRSLSHRLHCHVLVPNTNQQF